MNDSKPSSTEAELSLNEKRVLIALSALNGKGTPEEIMEQVLPQSLRELTKVVKDSLQRAMDEVDLSLNERELTEIIKELSTISKSHEREVKSQIITILVKHLSVKFVEIEVPLQRKVIGKILGECSPAITKILSGYGDEPEDPGSVLSLVEVMNASSWLKSKSLVQMTEEIRYSYSLSSKRLGSQDLPERRVLKLLDKNHGVMLVEDVKDSRKLKGEEVPIALGWLKRKEWATIGTRGGETVLEITSVGKEHLSKKGKDEDLIEKLGRGELTDEKLDKDVITMLKKRQDILHEKERIIRTISLTQEGKSLLGEGLSLEEEISQLTPEIIHKGVWKERNIRPYDIEAFAPDRYGGRIHPLQQYIEKIRRIFLDMGFEEIEGDFVQSAFWNMDALFTAQDHPVREMHDTLYLEEPATIPLPDSNIVDNVKTMHETGDDDSDGWQYRWNPEEGKKALLRTHTTVNTIKYLSEHPDPPVKVFSIGRVFRNEAVDATHLPEFIQVEGIVMEEGANLDMLVGLLKEFYRKMGITEIRFRPGYFPYTEPSMEPEIFFNGQWMELGGSGIFRPEVVAPFGVKHPVLAWGLGLERLVMPLLGVNDIRKLYVSDIEWLRTCPIVR
jgi:phenylalanyl-tRNA synthetase alpha chain